MALDKITLSRIDQLHPKIRKEVRKLYEKINEGLLGKGVRLRFSQGYRTAAEQDSLYNKRPKVTNAKAWQSVHNYGLAFDIVILYDKDGDGTFEEASWDMKRDGDGDGLADWYEITNELLANGFQNGFISNGKKWDFPHFQKDFGLGWREMKAKIDSGDYTTENGIKYINI